MKVRALVVIVSIINIFVFLSCDREGDVKTLSIEIPTNIVCDRHPLDSLFDVDHFVILEETEESRVSQISKIFVSSNEIAILDNTYKILFFTSEGKFLRKIQKLGHARDEYISLSDFDIKGDTLYLLDNMCKKILTYRKDGKYINSIDIEVAKGLRVLENGIAINHEFGLANGSSSGYSYEYITNNEHTKDINFNPYLTGVHSHSPVLMMVSAKTEVTFIFLFLTIGACLQSIEEQGKSSHGQHLIFARGIGRLLQAILRKRLWKYLARLYHRCGCRSSGWQSANSFILQFW